MSLNQDFNSNPTLSHSGCFTVDFLKTFTSNEVETLRGVSSK